MVNIVQIIINVKTIGGAKFVTMIMNVSKLKKNIIRQILKKIIISKISSRFVAYYFSMNFLTEIGKNRASPMYVFS